LRCSPGDDCADCGKCPLEELNTISNTYNVTFKHHVMSDRRALPAESSGMTDLPFYVMPDSILRAHMLTSSCGAICTQYGYEKALMIAAHGV